MSRRIEQARFEHLVSALIDDRITNQQSEELAQLLLDDPARQQAYLDQIEVHLALTRILRKEFVSPEIPITTFQISQRTRFDRCLLGAMALAMTLLIVATTSLIVRSLPALKPPIVSTTALKSVALGDQTIRNSDRVLLAQNSSAEFFGTLPPKIGTAIEINHQLILTHGSIELVFPKGATALLEAPAIFSVVSANRLYIESGRCSVHAPDGAEGFEVETPLAKVIDLGTRFGVSVDHSGETNVQVIEGAAEVSEKSIEGRAVSPAALLQANHGGLYPADSDRPETSMQSDSPIYRYGLQDRILKYQAELSPDVEARGVQDLLAISVQRGGIPYHYPIEELIPSEVTSFRSTQREEIQPVAYRYGDERSIDELIQSDNSLDTGIFNPGASMRPLTQSPNETTVGMTLRFAKPVVNSIGPDIAFFELQSYDNPKLGDAFHVSPTIFRDSLHAFTVREFDIPMTSPEALEVAGFGLLRYEHSIDSLSDLHSGRYSRRYRHFNFRALAVGIDLSDLGYADNDVVSELFIQDADDDHSNNGGSMVDPVYVGGFPPVVLDRDAGTSHAAPKRK